MTDLNTDKWYVLLTLKKGTYSCLMALMWYNFCYNIYYVRQATKSNFDQKDKENWIKGCGIAFSIIFGIGTLAMSYLFKDLVIAGMTTFIYIGLTVYYFKLDKEKRKAANKNGDGIVDIIMLVGSVALLAYLLLTKREECLKS